MTHSHDDQKEQTQIPRAHLRRRVRRARPQGGRGVSGDDRGPPFRGSSDALASPCGASSRSLRSPQQETPYWYETHPSRAPSEAVGDVSLRPEAAFEFRFDRAQLEADPGLGPNRPSPARDSGPRWRASSTTASSSASRPPKTKRSRWAAERRVRAGSCTCPGFAGCLQRRTRSRPSSPPALKSSRWADSADGAIVNRSTSIATSPGESSLLADLRDLGVRIAARTRGW